MLKKLQIKFCKKYCPKKKPREIVIVYPFNTETQEIYLIQEYIHHYDRKFWKFVSGGIDKNGKDNLTHAREELAEEVGMESQNTYHLYSSEKIFGNRGSHFYVAENPIVMEHPPENPDTDIITDTRWVNQNQFQDMLDHKELLWDATTMCALQVFKRYSK
jgi:8-oxo-dGTP pyrophosphatase MutT (NUDIX family)